MSIDWITVAAQVVNFLILVWLLRRFLYGPVTRAMAEREQGIAARQEEAKATARAAEEERRRYEAMQEELVRKHEATFAEVQAEANELRQRLRAEAREEIEATRRRWKGDLAAERHSFLLELRRDLVERFVELARRALRDLAGEDLEEQIARTFADRIRSLPDDAAGRIAAACEAGDPRITVRSRFDLSPPAKRRLTEAIHERLGREVEVHYATTEEITAGIELRAAGEVVAWTLDAYLESLETHVREAMAEIDDEEREDGRE